MIYSKYIVAYYGSSLMYYYLLRGCEDSKKQFWNYFKNTVESINKERPKINLGYGFLNPFYFPGAYSIKYIDESFKSDNDWLNSLLNTTLNWLTPEMLSYSNL